MRKGLLFVILVLTCFLITSCDFKTNNPNQDVLDTEKEKTDEIVTPDTGEKDEGHENAPTNIDFLDFGNVFATSKADKCLANGNDLDDYNEIENDNVTFEEIERTILKKYQRNNEITNIEKDRLYNFSLPFIAENRDEDNLATNFADIRRAPKKYDNYIIDSVNVDGEEVEYSLEDGELNFDYKTPSDENEEKTVIINLHDSDGNQYINTGKIKYKPENKHYDIKIEKATSFSNGVNFVIDIKKNTNAKGDLWLLVLNDEQVVGEKYIYEGTNNVTFNNLKTGVVYKYIIVRKVTANSMNSAIIWGEIMALLPYSVVYNDITSTSFDVSISNKGAFARLSKVELYDGENLLESKGVCERYVYTNLSPKHNYSLKIYYSYYNDKTIVEESFIKSISTLDSNEKLINLRISPSDFLNNNSISWTNGTNFSLQNVGFGVDVDRFLIQKLNDNNESLSSFIELNLAHDTIFTANIYSSNESGDFERLCNIFNDDLYYVIRTRSSASKFGQSLYLKAGKYKIYANTYMITFKDISLKQIIPTNEYNNIISHKTGEYSIIDEGEHFYKVDEQFNPVGYKLYEYYSISDNYNDYFTECDESVKYYFSKLEDSNKEEVKIGDVINPAYAGEVYLSFGINNGTIKESYKYKIYNENSTMNMKLFDDGNILQELKEEFHFYRNEPFDFSRVYVLILVDDCEYKRVYLKDNDLRLNLSFIQNEVEYNDLALLDTSLNSSGEIVISYADLILGNFDISIPYVVESIEINSLTIYTTKNRFLSYGEVIHESIKVEAKNGKSITFNSTYKELLSYKNNNIGDLDEINLNYYFDSGCNQSCEIPNGTFYARVQYGNIFSNVVELTIVLGTDYYVYNGQLAKNGNCPDGYVINSKSLINCRCGLNEGDSCVEDGGAVSVRAYSPEDYIMTSNALTGIHEITVSIIAGTNTTRYESYLTVEILDKNYKVLDSKTKLACYEKVSKKVFVDFYSEEEISYVKICNMTNVKFKLGIASINITYFDQTSEYLKEMVVFSKENKMFVDFMSNYNDCLQGTVKSFDRIEFDAINGQIEFSDNFIIISKGTVIRFKVLGGYGFTVYCAKDTSNYLMNGEKAISPKGMYRVEKDTEIILEFTDTEYLWIIDSYILKNENS